MYNELIENCLTIARKSEGHVSPNPLVGAILLDENGNFISSGYHQKYGEAHAEVNAIKNAEGKTQNATLIVNLEPCSHWGKTPPCVDLIIKSGIKKVVIGMCDPNPKVNTNGIKKLKEAGIEVIAGVNEEKCRKLNEIFIINQTENRSFVAIKSATTTDGKIATSTNDSKWITSENARNYVHKLRNRYDAILTSANTVICDNPEMTCRTPDGRNPIRVILDRNLRTNLNSKIYADNGTKVFIAVDEKIEKLPQVPSYIEFIKCPTKNGGLDLSYLLKKLYEKSIMSIIIEAGGKLNGAFIKVGLADKIYHFIAPKIIGDNCAKSWIEGFSPIKMEQAIKMKLGEVKSFEPDIMMEYYL